MFSVDQFNLNFLQVKYKLKITFDKKSNEYWHRLLENITLLMTCYNIITGTLPENR